MIIKNKKTTSITNIQNKNRIKYQFMVITIAMFGMSFGYVSIPNAEAAQCSSPHCYATGYDGVTLSGTRFTTVITDLVPVSSCVDTPTVTHWTYFANGDTLEDGFTSGLLAGSCYTTEKSYYATDLTVFGYTEYNAGSVTISNTHTFEISDTDKNQY